MISDIPHKAKNEAEDQKVSDSSRVPVTYTFQVLSNPGREGEVTNWDQVLCEATPA